MNILDKYPAPWRYDDVQPCWNGHVVSATENVIIYAEPIGESNSRVIFENKAVQRLILAAPELLAALKNAVDDCPNTKDVSNWRSEQKAEAMTLIARIEGTNA